MELKEAYRRIRDGGATPRERMKAHAIVLSNVEGVGSAAVVNLIAEALAELIAYTLQRD